MTAKRRGVGGNEFRGGAGSLQRVKGARALADQGRLSRPPTKTDTGILINSGRACPTHAELTAVPYPNT